MQGCQRGCQHQSALCARGRRCCRPQQASHGPCACMHEPSDSGLSRHAKMLMRARCMVLPMQAKIRASLCNCNRATHRCRLIVRSSCCERRADRFRTMFVKGVVRDIAEQSPSLTLGATEGATPLRMATWRCCSPLGVRMGCCVRPKVPAVVRVASSIVRAPLAVNRGGV